MLCKFLSKSSVIISPRISQITHRLPQFGHKAERPPSHGPFSHSVTCSGGNMLTQWTHPHFRHSFTLCSLRQVLSIIRRRASDNCLLSESSIFLDLFVFLKEQQTGMTHLLPIRNQVNNQFIKYVKRKGNPSSQLTVLIFLPFYLILLQR